MTDENSEEIDEEEYIHIVDLEAEAMIAFGEGDQWAGRAMKLAGLLNEFLDRYNEVFDLAETRRQLLAALISREGGQISLTADEFDVTPCFDAGWVGDLVVMTTDPHCTCADQ